MPPDDRDPALDQFLALLADDLHKRPEAVQALTPELAARLATLTEGATVDLDAPIEGCCDI